VIVVGAGLAGLTVSLALEDTGVVVQLIEARSRVGGRVHSMSRPGGSTEAGGTYIGAGYHHVIAAAERLGVGLVDVTPRLAFFREQELVLGGEIIRRGEWPGHALNAFPAPDRSHMPWEYQRILNERSNPLERPEEWLDPANVRHDIPARGYLARAGSSDDTIRLAYCVNPTFGSDARDVSALLIFFRAAFSAAQRGLLPPGIAGYTIRGGVQRLPEAMARALRHEIHFCKAVTAITMGRGGVEVCCADGSRYLGERAVCALPFGVLRDITIDPPLTGPQREAVELLPAQPVTQVYLARRGSFWERDGHAPSLFTDGPAGMVAALRNGADPEEVTGFTAWLTGPGARRLDALPDDHAGRLVIESIEAVRPAAKGELEFLGRRSWGSDPFARGGWPYFAPGQIARFAASMGRPHGRLHFCGDQLAITSRGMEGAMESGERAAAEIIAPHRSTPATANRSPGTPSPSS